ncbi:calcium-binding protein (plasmid) [Shewanella baltica]|uniref:calcium-binding protein n=1 Tax=Shewanella baltica TaxID=62322 RepID=UPI0030D569F1
MTKPHDLLPPTQGGLKTLYRANRATIRWTILGIMLMTVILCWLLLDKDTLLGAYYYALYSGRALLQPAATIVQTHWQGVVYTSTLGEQLHNPILSDMFTVFTTWLAIIFGGCTTLGLIFMATDPRFRVNGKPLSILTRILVSVGLLLAFYGTLTALWLPSYPPVLTFGSR